MDALKRSSQVSHTRRDFTLTCGALGVQTLCPFLSLDCEHHTLGEALGCLAFPVNSWLMIHDAHVFLRSLWITCDRFHARKFLSVVVSIIWFGNAWTNLHSIATVAIFGAALKARQEYRSNGSTCLPGNGSKVSQYDLYTRHESE